MKRIVHALSVLLLLLSHFLPAARVVAEEIGRVETSIGYSTTSTTHHTAKELQQYRLTLDVSERTYDDSYSLIKVSKEKFGRPTPDQVSVAASIKDISISEEAENYIIRINYNRISEASIVIPFNLFLLSKKSYDGETLLVETEYHKNDGTVLARGEFRPYYEH